MMTALVVHSVAKETHRDETEGNPMAMEVYKKLLYKENFKTTSKPKRDK